MQKLILWDIDSTLLTTNGIAAEMMRESMRQLFGSAPSKERSIYAGKTDRQIIRETFPHFSSEQIDRAIADFTELYIKLLRQQHNELLAKTRVYAGAPFPQRFRARKRCWCAPMLSHAFSTT